MLFFKQCQESGNFTQVPFCKPVECLTMPLLDHISETLNIDKYGSNSYLSTVTYVCTDGYYLEGVETLTCMSNGMYGNITTGSDFVTIMFCYYFLFV